MNIAPQAPTPSTSWSAGHVSGPQGPPPSGPQAGPPPSGPQGPPPQAGPPPSGRQGPWSPGPAPAFPPPPRSSSRFSRLPSGAEVLGWGGGLTTLVGVAAVTWDFWAAISGLALVALLLVATTVLGVAAAVVGDLDRGHDDQLAANLSAGLWVMTGIAASFSIYVATDTLSGGRAYLALLAAAGAATAMFGAAAHRTGRDSLLAGAVISAGVAAFAAASLASTTAADRGLAVWGVAVVAALGLAVVPRPPSRTTFATALTMAVGGAQAVLQAGGGAAAVSLVLVGMVAVAGVAVWRRSRAEGLSATLVAGLVTCQVLYDLAPQVFSLSTTVLLSGIAMTIGCIHLVRRSTRDR